MKPESAHVLGIVVFLVATSTEPRAQADPSVEVLLLGTYHFNNPGLDEYNTVVDDYFEARRQEEILRVVDRLVAFKPDRVFVEILPASQPELDRTYAAFCAGELALEDLRSGRSEVYQLGYRVARALEHPGVIAVDARGRWLGSAVREAAEASELGAYRAYDEAMVAWMRERSTRFAEGTVLDNLIYMNTDEIVSFSNRFYNEVCPLVVGSDSAAEGGASVGGELVGEWYKRNAKIYGNIVRGVQQGDERVLVIVGQGHVRTLQQFFSDHPGFALVPANRVLDDRAPRPLSVEDLLPHTRYLDVKDGALIALEGEPDGAMFLSDELERHTVVLLGEYHGSPGISHFTAAIVSELHELGCRNMVLETGPTGTKLLLEAARAATGAVAGLRAFNSSHVIEGPTRSYLPVPFFASVEDAVFLGLAIDRDWSFFGIDQEYLYGLIPLVERAYNLLEDEDRADLRPSYDEALDALRRVYRESVAQNASPSAALAACAPLRDFLSAGAERSEPVEELADDVLRSLEIYRLNTVAQYRASNRMRIEHMKHNLSRGLAARGLDLARDRLLVKMGAIHTGRGLSLLRLYEVGNTLSELAESRGRSSLHIYFTSRYRLDGGRLVDGLVGDPRYERLRSLGRPDRWTIIDLRPLKSRIFYDRLTTERFLGELFTQQDLVVIPPAEAPPTPNRD